MNIADRIAEIRQKAGHTQESLATETGITAEFFESKIPEKYEEPEHQQLHEMLQAILEDGPEAESAIKWNVEAIYQKIKRERKRPPEEKEASQARKRQAG